MEQESLQPRLGSQPPTAGFYRRAAQVHLLLDVCFDSIT
jgi:hypothetical protein